MWKIIAAACCWLMGHHLALAQTEPRLYPTTDTPFLWIENRYLVHKDKDNYVVYEASPMPVQPVGTYATMKRYAAIPKCTIEQLKRKYGLKDLPIAGEGFGYDRWRHHQFVYYVPYKEVLPGPGYDIIGLGGTMTILFKDSLEVETFYPRIKGVNASRRYYLGRHGWVERTNNPVFEVYPTPAKSMFYIKILFGKPQGSYTLSDLDGKTVLQGELQGERTTVSLPEGMRKGTYVLQVISEQGSFNIPVQCGR